MRWPGVKVSHIFGILAFHRRKVMFAMLPDKRALRDSNAFMYKLPSGAERREGEKWKFFPLNETGEINAALAMLDKAYRKAAQLKRK